MEKNDIVALYKQGYSIDSIIDKYYYSKKQETRIINLQSKKFLLLTTDVRKKDLRGEVYKIIYSEIFKKIPPI